LTANPAGETILVVRVSMTDIEPQIAAARAYEAIMVPALFGEWADPMLRAADVRPGQQVLDVACGTGVLARAAYARTQPLLGTVAGIDVNPGMLAVARRIEPAVEWREGRADALPFADGSFDAVVSQFGLMFFPKRTAAVKEMMRVLRTGGQLAVAVWDSLDNTPAYAIEVEILERVAGQYAANALRAPFALGDREGLEALLEEAGLHSFHIETRVGTGRFPSVQVMVEADLRGWLPLMEVELSEPQIQKILEAAEEALSGFVRPNGEIVFDSPAHIITATKP